MAGFDRVGHLGSASLWFLGRGLRSFGRLCYEGLASVGIATAPVVFSPELRGEFEAWCAKRRLRRDTAQVVRADLRAVRVAQAALENHGRDWEMRVKKVGYVDVPPDRRRGGELRILLSPRTVGASAGFLGVGHLGVGCRMVEHYHPYSEEYLYVVSGQLTVQAEGRATSVSPGEAVMVPKHVPHRLVNEGSEDLLAVFFLGPLAPSPELGHVDTESLSGLDVLPAPGSPA